MLGVLMVLTPLGLLAAGTAWGEWAAADFSDPAARQAIAAASLGHAPPPARAQRASQRLSSAWTAPLADYAPPFVRSAAVGYVLSAMFGAGLVVLAVDGHWRRSLPGARGARRTARRRRWACERARPDARGFVERTIDGAARGDGARVGGRTNGGAPRLAAAARPAREARRASAR